MEDFAYQLARLRAHVAARRALPLDLGAWAIGELARVAGSAELRVRRNDHLCRAGAIIGGTVRQRALGVLKESRAIERTLSTRGMHFQADNPLRREVQAALFIAPIPAERQLRTILAASTVGTDELAVPGVSISTLPAEHGPHGQECDRYK